MTASVKFSIPYYLRQSVEASVEVDSRVVESAPDIAICNSDGYMYEIKGGKVVNSLNLKKETGSRMFCVHLAENNSLVIFYLILTNSNKLLIIKRLDSLLEVTKVYEEVKDFEVNDSKSLGYPQIRIEFMTSEMSVVEFPINNTEALVDKLEYDKNLKTVATSLAESLQIVCRHVDGLREEFYSVKKLCQPVSNTENFNLVHVDSIRFSVPLEKCTEKIIVSAKWIKIIGSKLVLGMKILNNGKEAVSELEFQMYEKMIKEYSYRFFSYFNEIKSLFLSPETVNKTIQPGQEITVVGAVSIGFLDFSSTTKVQILCFLSSAKLKNHLLRETFEISMSDVIEYGNKFFSMVKEACSVEDLQSIRTVKLETKLKIQSKNVGFGTMEKILKENLGFTRIEYTKGELYYCTSNYLNEVFVAFIHLEDNECVWKIILYTRDEPQIYFLVNMFYELLPEYTTIDLDED